MANRKKPKKSSRPPKILTRDEMQFCEYFCIHGNQTEAYRQTWPGIARPADHATKLMKREDVQAHILKIHAHMEAKAAERSAEALTLSLEKADSLLAGLMEQRRHNRGEMLTQMTGRVHDKGLTFDTVTGPQGGKKVVPVYSDEFTASLEQPKPIEDADLLKAIDATFKRLGAYPAKKDVAPVRTTNVFLYRSQWLQRQQQAVLAAGENG